VSADGGDTEGASAGVRTRARIRSGIVVGSPKGSVRKAMKRGSPNKPAGERAGCVEVQPLGRRQVGCVRRLRMVRVRITGAQAVGRMWRTSLSGFAADGSSMEAGMGRLLD
jgi:hypothetical protein